ncbi:SBBP repeat-containing protein [Sorangium sp. So ce204]|uniref:SBBP repeat-containing protein n=1 Tax=Sorangium sp. So ce204 TaxID=3133288 RepID=UPI003F63BBD6
MQAQVYILGSIAGLILCASGCAALLGLDEFADQSPGGSGAGGVGGAGGAGGAGGGAEPTPCTPDASEACYSGPPVTRNEGLCREGRRTCSTDRTWGACEHEVLPTVERCDVADDENCDGFQCIVWAAGYEQTGHAGASALATDAVGNVFVSVAFAGIITVGGKSFSSASNRGDVLLLKLSPAGEPLWAKKFGDLGADYTSDLAVDSKGNPVLVGESHEGGIDFGGGPLPAGPFIARFDATGEYIWSSGLGGRGALTGVAIDASDDIVVAGRFSEPIDLGEGSITPDGEDILVAKLDGATGRVSEPGCWVRTFNGTSFYEAATAVAVDSSKNIFVLAWSVETINLSTRNAPIRVDGGQFVVKLTPAGESVWARGLDGPGSGDVHPTSITVDQSSRPVVVGSFTGEMHVGDHTLPGGDDRDVFVVQLEANGVPRWMRAFGDAVGQQEAYKVARDPSGNLVVVGPAEGQIDFGDGPLKARGRLSSFVAKLTPDAKLVWSYLMDTTGDDDLRAITILPDGETIVAGGTTAPDADFGTGPLPGTGDGELTRVVIAKLGR